MLLKWAVQHDIVFLSNPMRLYHGIINYIHVDVDVDRHQSKMSSSKKIYILRGDFAARVYQSYKLEIQSVMLVFSTQLYELLPL